MPFPSSGYNPSEVIYTVSVAGVSVTFNFGIDQTGEAPLPEQRMDNIAYAIADQLQEEYPGDTPMIDKHVTGSRPMALVYPQ